MKLDAFSYGGGVQSTAALALAVDGSIECSLFLFANTGDDSEHPATLAYVRDVAMPYAAAHGLELLELRRGGLNPTLMTRLERNVRSLPIPVRMDGTGRPGRRSCTEDYKIDLIRRELNARGATRDKPMTLGLGISIDEIERVRSAEDPRTPTQRRLYPLVELRLARQDAVNVIVKAGLPVPPRSACFFCPFHTIEEWRRLKRDRPDLFDKSVEIEAKLQARRADLGRDPVWLTDAGAREGLTLDKIIGYDGQLTLEEESACEGGFCMT